ncbi:MAG: DNA-binding protein, partial [Prevotellaceae bacterium]|nr:DNA-binding protein [Prevotellaceae bacterium]
MIEFEIKSKKQTIGLKQGQTVYYAQLKTQQKMTNKMLVERIVRETS